MNIYAPTDLRAQPEFWKELEEQWDRLNLPVPTFMLGDFNLTEDPLDRAPTRPDYEPAVSTLRDCRQALNVQDAWRQTHPTDRCFTYTSANNTLSRIDRIYTQPDASQFLYDWAINASQVPTDHKVLLVKYAPGDAPFIGKGRWSWPLGLLHDTALTKQVIMLGQSLQNDIHTLPEDDRSKNLQTLWEMFKVNITRVAKAAARTQLAKIERKKTNLKKDLATTLCSETLDSEEDTRRNVIALEREIDHLEKMRYKSAHLRAQATWQLKGESINKYWTKVNNPRTPRDLIRRLRDPETNKIETRSDKMTNITAQYHKNLQREGLLPETNHLRQAAITEALDAIPLSQRLTNPDSELSPMNEILPRDKIERALRNVKLGTAPGPDGIPYEVWKHLDRLHKAAKANNEPYFDVINCMTMVIQDIQTHGVSPGTNFTLGYLCPIYKKKERDNVKNYRPITLLNTDYKLMTKSLSLQLATHIHQLIHPDQTGFIPNRTIFDPIRLAQTIGAYAEYMEEDGVIVALDQEKAYDKIDHGYLLHVLQCFNLPELFINTIQSLYSDAHTAAMVNGELSPHFWVTRGVRQGDPLSCLLFDLAIEPLACMLHSSPNLKGFTIPGVPQRVVVNLYTDDTTVYLCETDSYTDLQRILSRWCLASGARFNLEKTEIVPIGRTEHRARIVSTRRVHPSDPPLHPDIRIAVDGHPVRCLGAWIGNDLRECTPWNPVLDKVRSTLKKWNKASPSLDAKGYIIQMFAGGMTQFLTKAQNMPKEIESALVSIIREFIWNSNAPSISLRRLYAPKCEGGINFLTSRHVTKRSN